MATRGPGYGTSIDQEVAQLKVVVKGMVALAALVTLPAAAAILESKQGAAPKPTNLARKGAFSIHEKDQSRVAPSATAIDASARGQPFVRVAQSNPMASQVPPPTQGGSSPFRMPVPPGMAPQGPPPDIDRDVCEEKVHSASALIGYYRSKLRLEESQRAAWSRLEQAADAGIAKLHAACDALPKEAGASHRLPQRLDTIVRLNTADLEFLVGIREPLRTLFEQLSSQQQRLLQLPTAGPAF